MAQRRDENRHEDQGSRGGCYGSFSRNGQSAAREFARAGGRVAMLARSPEVLSLADEIVAAGGEARGYCVDLTDPAAFEKVARQIVSDLGAPEIIVNNAGAVPNDTHAHAG